MAFGFSQNAWQAGTQSPWRQGYAPMSPMRPGAGLSPIYQPSEFAQATPATVQNSPAQMPFGGFMPMPIPMPMPMSMGYPQQQTARMSNPFMFDPFNQYIGSQYGIMGGFS